MLFMPLPVLSVIDDDDRTYMEKLYSDYYRLMYSAAYKVTKTRNGLDDIVSDACIALIRKISVLRSFDCNILRCYIITTVKNTALAYAYREKRHQGVVGSEDIIAGKVDITPEFIDSMIHEEMVNSLMKCLEKLSPRDQEILKMKYLLNMSDGDMADKLNVKAVTVRACLTRARKRAYKIMKEMMDNEE